MMIHPRRRAVDCAEIDYGQHERHCDDHHAVERGSGMGARPTLRRAGYGKMHDIARHDFESRRPDASTSRHRTAAYRRSSRCRDRPWCAGTRYSQVTLRWIEGMKVRVTRSKVARGTMVMTREKHQGRTVVVTAGNDMREKQCVVVDINFAQQLAFEPGEAVTQGRYPRTRVKNSGEASTWRRALKCREQASCVSSRTLTPKR